MIALISTALSQNNEVGKKYVYEFRDGTTIIGTFIKDESGNIFINDLQGNETYIPRVMVAQIHEVNDKNLIGDEYWFPNLHDSRYFFSPTAFGLEQGEGYYSHSYWMLWQAQYGITDNFSIGGGATPLGAPTTINMKYSFNVGKKLNAAAGWFYVGDLLGVSGGNISSLINMPYGVITRGNKENNFTLGLGFSISDDLNMNERTVLNLGGTFRASRRFSIVFEAWVFNAFDSQANILGGPGIRYFRKINRVTAKNGAGASTFDFQLLFNPDFDGLLPMFGASKYF
jgi:hypothetical protein